MKNYFTLNRIIGLCSMAVFVLFVTFGSSLTLAKGILFFVLGLVISFAAFYIINLNIPADRDECWLSMVPFMGIMALCSLILGWDVYLPFLICGLMAVGVSAAVRQVRRIGAKAKTNGVPPVTFKKMVPYLKLFGTVAASVLMFVCICGFVEVFI